MTDYEKGYQDAIKKAIAVAPEEIKIHSTDRQNVAVCEKNGFNSCRAEYLSRLEALIAKEQGK